MDDSPGPGDAVVKADSLLSEAGDLLSGNQTPTTGSPGGVVEVDSTQVRLRKHRNDQTSSPVTTLKHEVARVAQRWSEAHPDEFDDSDEECLGFSHGSEDPPDFGGVSSDDDHHRTPLRHSLDAATLDLDAHNPFRNSASLSSSDEASGTMAVRAADSFGSVTEMAPLSEEAEAETGVAGEGQAGAETEAENPREVASPEEAVKASSQERTVFKLRKIVQELLSTERGFCEALDKLGVLEQNLRRDFLSVQESSLLFGNLEALTNLHAALYADLLALVPKPDEWAPPLDELEATVKLLCRVFTSTDFLTVYAPYCANHPAQLSTLEARKPDEAFQKALKGWQSTEGASMPVESFLLKPVQRILKYPLLLDQLVRSTPEGSVAAAPLQQARRMLEAVAENANRIKRQQELETLMAGDVLIVRGRTLGDKLKAGGFDGDIALFGALLDEASGLTMVAARRRTSRKPKQRTLYLFRRALLSCKHIDANRISVKRIFPVGQFHVKGLKRQLEVLEQSTSIRYTFSGLDGLDWASTISTLRAPNAPCHSPAPPTAEDSPGGPPKEDSPKQADLPQDSSPKAFFAPLSPHLPTQRSKTMPGAVERLTQERAGLLKRNEKLLKERWAMMRQQTAAAEERQAFVTAQQLILEQKEAQLKGLEAEVGTLKVAMAAAEEEDRERTEDYEAHCADLEAQLEEAQADRADTEAEVARLQSQLETQSQGLSELQTLHKARLATLESTIAELKAAAGASKTEIAEATARIAELETSLEASQAEGVTTREVAAAAADEAATAAAQAAATATDAATRLARLSLTLGAESEPEGGSLNLEQALAAVEAAVPALCASDKAAAARAAAAEAEVAAQKERVVDLEKVVAAKEVAISEGVAAMAAATAAAESARKERDELGREARAAAKAQEKADRTATSLRTELKLSQEATKKLRRELKETQHLVDAGVKLEVEHAEARERLQQTVVELREELNSLRRSPVEEEESELARLRMELAQTKAELHQFQGGSSPAPPRRETMERDGSQASVDLLDASRALAPSNPQSGPETTEDGIVGWIGGWFE